MGISSHENGDFGYLKVASPDGNNIAEFKRLCEVGMGAPTKGELWVNGRRVFGLKHDFIECCGFGPSCAWSPDSNYLALIMWGRGRSGRGSSPYTICAIYDAHAELLHPIDSKRPIIFNYTIETFQDLIDSARRYAKLDLHETLNIPEQSAVLPGD